MLMIWLFVCCIRLMHVDGEQIVQTHGTLHIINAKTNWWESRYRCREDFQGDLLQSEDIPQDAADQLNRSAYYWIGAMTYGTWKWTIDNTALYQYAGYRQLPAVPTGNRTFVDNSVFRCNLHCKEDYSVFGLSDNTCYCLQDVPEDASKIRGAEAQCAGNLDESCGDMDGMSVYVLGETPFIPKTTGKCAYVYKNYAGHIYITTTACAESKKFVCSFTNGTPGYGCSFDVKHNTLQWTESNDSCNLLKLTTNCPNLKDLLTDPSDFWIGLRMATSITWLNGSDVVSGAPKEGTEPSSALPTCLAVIKDPSSDIMRFEWLSCSLPQRYICKVGLTENFGITGASGNGMYVGISIGCVFIGTAILLLVVMRRQRMLCFKCQDGGQRVHYHSATGRTTNGVDTDIKPENSEYCVIDKHEPRLTTSSAQTKEDYNVLSLKTKQKSLRTRGHSYSHLSGSGKHLKYRGDYDTAESVQHAGDRGGGAIGGYRTIHSDGEQKGEHGCVLSEGSEEEKYNVLGKFVSSRKGCSHAGVYDHIGTDEGHYDVTLQGKNAREAESYSHISRPYTCLEDGHYDVASTGQMENTHDGTHNHVG
ncbi:uncharacterized protein LOC124134891 [Haliotis rufescens]|uniref:uncharacterized protein LOC124134891 n=1 Tax=Haliotis rufescens TaxID=6454 RepID=UPI00201F7B9A|nr:uncharacterized protein LOC124134891 [Haliotis rufescens]